MRIFQSRERTKRFDERILCDIVDLRVTPQEAEGQARYHGVMTAEEHLRCIAVALQNRSDQLRIGRTIGGGRGGPEKAERSHGSALVSVWVCTAEP